MSIAVTLKPLMDFKEDGDMQLGRVWRDKRSAW